MFAIGVDPVRIGLVTGLDRTGTNITDVSDMNFELGARRLGLLRQMLPQAKRFAVLANLDESNSDIFVADTQAARASQNAKMRMSKPFLENRRYAACVALRHSRERGNIRVAAAEQKS